MARTLQQMASLSAQAKPRNAVMTSPDDRSCRIALTVVVRVRAGFPDELFRSTTRKTVDQQGLSSSTRKQVQLDRPWQVEWQESSAAKGPLGARGCRVTVKLLRWDAQGDEAGSRSWHWWVARQDLNAANPGVRALSSSQLISGAEPCQMQINLGRTSARHRYQSQKSDQSLPSRTVNDAFASRKTRHARPENNTGSLQNRHQNTKDVFITCIVRFVGA